MKTMFFMLSAMPSGQRIIIGSFALYVLLWTLSDISDYFSRFLSKKDETEDISDD